MYQQLKLTVLNYIKFWKSAADFDRSESVTVCLRVEACGGQVDGAPGLISDLSYYFNPGGILVCHGYQ